MLKTLIIFLIVGSNIQKFLRLNSIFLVLIKKCVVYANKYIVSNIYFKMHVGEICEFGFILKIGHFLWDFELLFRQLNK